MVNKDIKHFSGSHFTLINHGTLYSAEYKAMYIKIGKTGGTSIFRGYLEHRVPDFTHATKDEKDGFSMWCHNFTQEQLDDCFVFTFVRNPFSRVVSAACAYNIDPGEFIDNLEKYVPYPDQIEQPVTKAVYNERNAYFHAQPCSMYTHYNGEQMVDFIGRMENLQEHFDIVCDKMGIEHKQLERRNTTKHADYRTYYNEARIKKIEERYKDDLDIFGYKFE